MKTAQWQHLAGDGRLLAAVLCTCMALLTAWPAGAQDLSSKIQVGLDRAKIFEGESAVYSVMVDNVENPVPPKLEGFDDFEVESLGVDVRDSRHLSIINGRRTQFTRRRRVYSFRLTPRRAGILVVPAPTAEADGRPLRGEEISLEVIAPVEQDVANVRVSIDPPAVYPTQAFTITVTVAVKGLPNPHGEQSPVRVQGTSRGLQIPWAIDRDLPEGLQPVIGAKSWLNSLISSSGGGFGINALASSDLIRLRQRRVLFEPTPERVAATDAAGNSVEYWEYRFARQFVADRVGQFLYGPVTLKGSFADGATASRRPNVVSVFSIAEPLTLTVKDVPTAGRPVSYTGAVGSDFQLVADLVPTVAKVGDPMGLTLVLSGQGTLEQAAAPEVEEFPEIAERFAVQATGEESRDGTRRFTFTVRPRKAGIEQLPAVPFSFFNAAADRFETVHSEPIPVSVRESQQMDEDQIVAASPLAATGELEIQEGGIFANIDDPAAVRDQTVRPGRWLTGLGGMVGAYCLIALLVRGVQRRMEDPALVRRRAAAANARRRLRAATAELQAGRLRQGAEGVRAAMVGLVADVADLPEAGLTPKEVEKQLAGMGTEEALIGRLHALWEKCDVAQFGASAEVLDRLGHEAAELIDALISRFKSLKRFR